MCEDLRYGQCRVLSSSFVCCDFSSTPCASTFSIGSLPLTDSDWFVRVGSDNARISCRISASRSGGLGGVLIYVRDATDLNFCLVLRSFCCRRRESRLFARVRTIPRAMLVKRAERVMRDSRKLLEQREQFLQSAAHRKIRGRMGIERLTQTG